MHRFRNIACTLSVLIVVGSVIAWPATGYAQADDEDNTEPISGLFLNDYSEFTSSGIQIDGIGSGTVDYNIPTIDADEDHTINITEVGASSVTFTLSAHPAAIGATLQSGETKQYDVNDDKSNDIEIGLRSVSDQLANMTFKQVVASNIVKAVPLGNSNGNNVITNPDGTKTTIDPVTGQPVAVDTTNNAVGTVAATKQKLKTVLAAPWQVYLAVALTVAIIVSLYYRWHHRKFVKSLFETHWPNNDPDLR